MSTTTGTGGAAEHGHGSCPACWTESKRFPNQVEMMTDLAAKDLRSVIDVVYALHDGHGAVDLPSHVVVQLGDLVGCESSFYSRVEHATGRLLDTISEPIEADLRHLPGFHSAMSQHPGFAAYHSGRMVPGTPIALTDLADLPSLRRLALYVDYYRPHGTVD
ncbi:MAG: hypothetical protein ACRDQ5_07345, partial [Sciscionella sp.]